MTIAVIIGVIIYILIGLAFIGFCIGYVEPQSGNRGDFNVCGFLVLLLIYPLVLVYGIFEGIGQYFGRK